MIAEKTLTQEQEVAYNNIMKYLNGSVDCTAMVLFGYAGTGKTYTISHVLQDFVEQTGQSIALAAPSNSAVQVLRKMLPIQGATYKTIHSLLALKPRIKNNGEIEFVQERKDRATVHEYGVVVVDESSMLNDEIFDLIEPYFNRVKFIFVGDPKQIRPVSTKANSRNKLSPIFRKEVLEAKNIKKTGLRNIVRQAGSSGIIPLSFEIRNNNFAAISDEKYDDVEIVNNIDSFLPYFDKDDRFYCKVLAYTNKAVNKYNDQIRQHIYKDEARNKIVIGERLIANTPIFHPLDRMTIMFTTNDTFQVEDYQIDELRYEERTFKVYNCLLDNGDRINILHEGSEDYYQQSFDMLVAIAKAQSKIGKGAQYWRNAYQFKETFADIKYDYAITCHKAQGSTFDYVFINYQNIMSCYDEKERQGLLYTAVTRAAKKVYFLV